MKCYILSYDLVYQRNYEPLWTAIRSYPNWAKITESTWAIVTDKSAAEIRDHLSRYMDSDDRIFIVKSGTESAWRNVICKSEWLQTNL